MLEKKRTSITRLKLKFHYPTPNSIGNLKRKEPRLRDWNISMLNQACPFLRCLEKKRTSITRLKQSGIAVVVRAVRLEKKRTSITRLKLEGTIFRCVVVAIPWKEKNLDYEIETSTSIGCPEEVADLKRKEPRLRDWNSLWMSRSMRMRTLEKKRTSITRLKQVH